MSIRWRYRYGLALVLCLVGTLAIGFERRVQGIGAGKVPGFKRLPAVVAQRVVRESTILTPNQASTSFIALPSSPECIRLTTFHAPETSKAEDGKQTFTKEARHRRCGLLGRWIDLHETHQPTGFIDVNSYWDTRHFAVTTINLLANLPNDFQFFQFANFDSPINSDSHDWNAFFTEMNLRRPICKDNPYLTHLDANIQYADGTFPRGNLRLGLRWRTQDTPGCVGAFIKEKLKLRYSVAFHFLETDGTGWQIEHFYRRDFFDGDVYIAAFCDHNIDNNSRTSSWVTEHQIGVRLIDPLYAVAEYRYNSFLPAGSRSGWGLGLEYVIRFQ